MKVNIEFKNHKRRTYRYIHNISFEDGEVVLRDILNKVVDKFELNKINSYDIQQEGF